MNSSATHQILVMAVALLIPFCAQAAGYAERGPQDLKAYLAEGRDPKFLRLDVKGYNIRKSADFSVGRKDNIDFKTKGGELYPVEGVKHLYYGASIKVKVNGDSRWVYVPYGRKDDFQFCESEACFGAMAEGLDFFLNGSGVTMQQAKACGVSVGPEGLILPPGAATPHREPDHPPVASQPRPPVRPHSSGGHFSSRPMWESARGETGRNWTQMMEESLERNGQSLLRQKHLSDANAFCPNFSRLDDSQRKEFWVHLFAGIARYESNFKLTEPAFNEANKTNVFRGPINPNTYSMGLFQLSYAAAPGYRPGCRIDWARDRGKDVSDRSLTIYDAKIQMDCAVTIMNKWVPRDGGVGLSDTRGGARFWSTLRSSNPATRNVIKSLKAHTACWN